MKIWLVLVCAWFFSCAPHPEDHSESKFAVREKAKATDDATAQSTSTTTETAPEPIISYYHAQLMFSHDGYESVDTAVRITYTVDASSSQAVPSLIEVKDLTPPATDPVESVGLTLHSSASEDDTETKDLYYGYSSGSDGGSYWVWLNADDTCCSSSIAFRPASNSEATFYSTLTKSLTAEEWEELAPQQESGQQVGGQQVGGQQTGGQQTGGQQTGGFIVPPGAFRLTPDAPPTAPPQRR